MSNSYIYLDHAATTPCDPRVLKAMSPFMLEDFANPNSPHRWGQKARKALEDSRAEIAALLGVDPTEIIFTSGATESNNAVLFSFIQEQEQAVHIVASALEHHCIIEPLKYWASRGRIDVTWVSPDANGIISPGDIKQALKPHTALVIVHHANNQIGTIQPLKEIIQVSHQQGVPVLADCVQTIGHIPVSLADLGVDYASFSGHKFYGPKGVGALYIAKKAKFKPMLLGGDQERGRRAGTVNLPGSVGLAEALRLATVQMSDDVEHDRALRDACVSYIQEHIPDIKINGDMQNRLPNNVNVSFKGIDSEQLLTALDLSGVGVSMGSACTSGRLTPSHVLKAIGLTDQMALGALRITVGRSTTKEQMTYFLELLDKKVKALRT